MSPALALWAGIVVAIAALVALWAIVRKIQKNAREVPSTPSLWSGRLYRCPDCGADMAAGWVMLGKGAIWSSRGEGPPGTFAHVGSALPNTISLSVRPAVNMAWRCPSCALLLIDHSQLVKPGKGPR
jgi:predicted RNA-binding Zn-ribbon protein involved in translation (DUF1610 family)